MKPHLTVALLFITTISFAQKADTTGIQKKYGIGFFPRNRATTIYGLSIGPFTIPGQKHTYDGLTIELIGTGLILDFGKGPSDSIRQQSNKANGIIVSSLGGFMNVNGIYLSGWGLFAYKMNGISLGLGFSEITYGNGLVICGFNNCDHLQGVQIGAVSDSYSVKGLQIGMINTTRKLKGLQIGIWNTNEKRRLPFINWDF